MTKLTRNLRINWRLNLRSFHFYASHCRNPICIQPSTSVDFTSLLCYFTNVLCVLSSDIEETLTGKIDSIPCVGKAKLNPNQMEDEGLSPHSSILSDIQESLSKLILAFYKNLKFYLQENRLNDQHIDLLKIILSKLFALQTNSIIFKSDAFPQILNVVFLVSLAMIENPHFSPASAIYFLTRQSPDSLQ